MIPFPRKCNQVIMEIFFANDIDPNNMKGLNRCRGALEAILLLDITAADGRYPEQIVFDQGGKTTRSRKKYPWEQPTKQDWDHWINFWQNFAATGEKLKEPLGQWSTKTHIIWQWYYSQGSNNLYHIEGNHIQYYKKATNWCHTRATTTYQQVWEELSPSKMPQEIPTSVMVISSTKINKLREGPLLAEDCAMPLFLWEYIASWGDNWMWEDIDDNQETKRDPMWISEGMRAGTLIRTTNESYDQKKGSLFIQSWMDNFPHQDRTPPDTNFLGEIILRKIIPVRDAWSVHPTPPGMRNALGSFTKSTSGHQPRHSSLRKDASKCKIHSHLMQH